MKKQYTEEDMKNDAKKAVWDYIGSDRYPGSAMDGTSFHGGVDTSIKSYKKTNMDSWWIKNKKYFGEDAIIARSKKDSILRRKLYTPNWWNT